MKKVLSTLLAATLLLTTVTGLQSLSVSAEDGTAASPVKELVQNGNFENDGVVINDDFSGADAQRIWGMDTIGRGGDVVTTDPANAENKCAQLYWDAAIARPVALKSNTTYRLSLKHKPSLAGQKGFCIAVGKDVRNTAGKLTWNDTESEKGFYPALSDKSADAPFIWTFVDWNQQPTDWNNISHTFTTGELSSSETYWVYVMAGYGVSSYVDDFKLEEPLPSAVEGGTLVNDPTDETNHCLQVLKSDKLTVSNFAVESNTFYKLSFKYKAIPNTEYGNGAREQLYCGINVEGNTSSTDWGKNAVEVFNQNGEWNAPYQSNWSGYRGLFGTWDSPLLSTVTEWRTKTLIIKTGAVDPNKVYKFAAIIAGVGGDMLLDDLSVTKLVSDSDVQVDFKFLGTAIRATSVDINNQQLRFKAQVEKEALEAGRYNGFTVTEYGFLAFRNDFLATNINEDLRLNVYTQKAGVVNTETTATLKRAAYTADVTGNATTDIVFSEGDTTKQFYACLTGFKTENYDKTYLVRTYAKLKNADGVELTVYLSGTEKLGVYDLAYTAFNEKNEDGSFAENLENRKTMWDLLQGSSYKGDIGTRPE